MWQFQSYTKSEPTIPDSAIMSIRSGLESRYADRFRSYAGTTDETLKSADDARKASDSLRTAAGVVEAQKENTDELFTTAELIIKMVNDFQRESGVKQIKNIPMAGPDIKASHGKKLGYTKLTMEFISSGLLHFMKMTIDMKDDIKSRDNIIRTIADNQVHIPILGRLTEVDLDDLASDDPIVESKLPLDIEDESAEKRKETSTYSNGAKANQDPLTPPKSPKPNDKKVAATTPTKAPTGSKPLKK